MAKRMSDKRREQMNRSFDKALDVMRQNESVATAPAPRY